MSDLLHSGKIFEFFPPLMSLAAYMVIDPVHGRLSESKLRDFLRAEGLSAAYPLVKGIAQDFSLQVVWISTVLSFLSSVVALADKQPTMALVVLLTGVIAGIPITLDLFLRTPGFHSTHKIGRSKILRPFARKDWTRFDVYGLLMACSNILFIILIALTLE